MSFNRFAKRRDLTQSEVVKTLNQAGVQTWEIGRPVDLLCRFWCTKHQHHCYEPLEVKTIHKGRRKPLLDKRQTEQIEFIEQTGCAKVTTGLEALLALSLKHGISSSFTSGGPNDHDHSSRPENHR